MGWSWDESLYAGVAPYYRRGRLPYPAAAADVLRDALGLDGTGRLLDLGCGPGSFTLVVAGLFEEAVGLDADAAMLAEAARAGGGGNVTWVHGRAEDAEGLGPFRVVTFAQSFHWFDRPRVAAVMRSVLEPGGAAVHVQGVTQFGAEDAGLRRPPHDEIAELVRRYLGGVRRAGAGELPDGTPDREDEVLRAVGFTGPQRFPVPAGEVFERSEDDVVATVFSRSSSAPHLFGDRLAAFEADLRALLRGAAPDTRFAERFPPLHLDVYSAGRARTL